MPQAYKKILISTVVLLSALIATQPTWAEPVFESKSVSGAKSIKNNHLSSRYPFLWQSDDFSEWEGFEWDDEQPRNLVGINLPYPEHDPNQGTFFKGTLNIYNLPSLTIISIKNLDAEAWSKLGGHKHSMPLIDLRNLPNLKTLDIGNSKSLSYRMNLESLAKFPKLTELNLSGSPYDRDDYKVLSKLKQLETLTIENSTIEDPYFLKELQNLKHLSLSRAGNYLSLKSVWSRKPIWNRHQSPINYGYLDNLKLESLDLSGNIISHIYGLSRQSSLKYLKMSGNEITRVEGLDALLSLEDLNLAGNSIQKIENLGNLSKLKSLNLFSNKIKEIEGLEALIKLESLNLRSNPFEEIKGLDTLVNLKILELDRVNEIKGLSSLKNLERLTIKGKHGVKWDKTVVIKDITGLDNNMALEYLDLSLNGIGSMEGLPAFKKLNFLNISYNYLNDLGALKSLPELNTLYLNGNNLVNIIGIERQKKLTDLDISRNSEIDDLSPLTGLPLLNKLKLSAMGYATFNGFRSESLTELNLAENLLEEFPDITAMPALEKLNLANNRINLPGSVSNLPRLKWLNLDRNPLSSAQEIIKALPHLEFLSLSRCGLNGSLDLTGSSGLQYLNISENQLNGLSGWNSLSPNSIIEMDKNSFPLSLLYELKQDSLQSGRQWRFGGKHKGVFGDVSIDAGTEFDLSREYSFDGVITRFKVVKVDGAREKAVLTAEDYEQAEEIPLDRSRQKFNPNKEPAMIDSKSGCTQDKGRFVFSETGSYRIYMYNDNLAYLKPVKEKHKDNVVEVSTGLITVR